MRIICPTSQTAYDLWTWNNGEERVCECAMETRYSCPKYGFRIATLYSGLRDYSAFQLSIVDRESKCYGDNCTSEFTTIPPGPTLNYNYMLHNSAYYRRSPKPDRDQAISIRASMTRSSRADRNMSLIKVPTIIPCRPCLAVSDIPIQRMWRRWIEPY